MANARGDASEGSLSQAMFCTLKADTWPPSGWEELLYNHQHTNTFSLTSLSSSAARLHRAKHLLKHVSKTLSPSFLIVPPPLFLFDMPLGILREAEVLSCPLPPPPPFACYLWPEGEPEGWNPPQGNGPLQGPPSLPALLTTSGLKTSGPVSRVPPICFAPRASIEHGASSQDRFRDRCFYS